MKNIVEHSELTCPKCGHKEVLPMPLNACQWLHECSNCHGVITPRPGDCCVFCSYGSVPCPPIQLQGISATPGGRCRDC